jgi:hypothetical protein
MSENFPDFPFDEDLPAEFQDADECERCKNLAVPGDDFCASCQADILREEAEDVDYYDTLRDSARDDKLIHDPQFDDIRDTEEYSNGL